jgi:hypothetical protein
MPLTDSGMGWHGLLRWAGILGIFSHDRMTKRFGGQSHTVRSSEEMTNWSWITDGSDLTECPKSSQSDEKMENVCTLRNYAASLHIRH